MEPEKKSNGALVGSIIVIIILVLGGIYFWMNQAEKESVSFEQQEAMQNLEAAIIEAENSLNQVEGEINASSSETMVDFEAEVGSLE